MAGGIGSRLLPLTADTPKPLIEIGGIPMIEILISRLAKQGFSNFFVAINHLGWQIEERLGTGEELGVNVQYLKEENTLGTAGALGLLRGAVDEPFLVANADLVTSCDFRALLDFHVASKSSATLGLREYVHEVPFGVVKLQGAHVANFEEKPLIREFVAAGIYCFDPSVIGTLHPPQHLDMPDLIGRLIEVESLNVAGFPIHEQWDDVGQLKDLERVRSHWKGASG
jgi:NDP-sugar pyrophosphorylase family protein